MPNLAALRAAIFLLSAKNRWGGAHMCPPGRARDMLPRLMAEVVELNTIYIVLYCISTLLSRKLR